ncbi:diadenylate cyclase [Engelhardtia mirabilis]|uniref:Diadenylate cyclase n=1 Tax=Engelhardtia mirabilis TaxID=2528011 RepID=A0A518BNG1_9BACT|nr:DisA bacterial checkpoint controller nucleotide-binding protein [Planctomycetes bacterium Pla133]QDV02845.1 DisA bacterial checkpoint controller nucleotide-binding protein [Planctomycetes bacterium Pla86]
MSLTASWILELVLVGAAIYLFLRVVRRSRGNRLARGLIVAFLLGAVGLFGLTELLELEELGFLLGHVTGYVLVALAIVFQPELRRAISQLGESHFLVGPSARLAHQTVDDLAAAARGLAKRRHGGLIAVQCESSLRPWFEKAVAVDAPVSRALLQSIFQPGGMLHDGGVVIREDRIVAAQCIFPLSESSGLSAFSGTRHRAGLGLSEETDALAIVISEETGRITLFRNGQRVGPVPPQELDHVLRDLLGLGASGEAAAGQRFGLAPIFAALRGDLTWLALSTAVAAAILWVVHGQLESSQPLSMTLRLAGPTDTSPASSGELVLRMPDEGWLLSTGGDAPTVNLTLGGTRRQIDRSGVRLAGEWKVPSPTPEQLPLDLRLVNWRGREPGLELEWTDGEPPVAELERVRSQTFDLSPEHLPIDASGLDRRFTWDLAATQIRPRQVTLRGPESALAELLDDPDADLLAPLTLPADSRGEVTLRMVLSPELVARGVLLANAEEVEVELLIRPSTRDAGTVEREIAVGCLDPTVAAQIDEWAIELHARTARLRIETTGLVPADTSPGSAAELERVQAIRRFVEDAVHVYVDLAELPDDGSSQSLPVRVTLRRNWRDSLAELGLDDARLTGEEDLVLKLESDPYVFLTPVAGTAGESDSDDS